MEHQRKPPSATARVRNEAASTPGDRFAAATRAGAVEVPYRAQMEAAFGADFGGVRAYLGRAEIAELGPEAIARGEHVAFASATPSVELVAHELVHVVQARRHGVPSGDDAMSSPSDAAEHEADAIAARVARGEQVAVAGAAPRAALSLRGPAFAGASEGLGAFGVEAKQMLIVLDDTGSRVPVTRDVLRERAAADQTVRVQVGPRTIDAFPAKLIDLASFHLSPDVEHDDMNVGAHEQSKFSPPVAYDVDEEHVYARWTLHTKNKWDRAAFDVRFPVTPTETLFDTKTSFVDPAQWNNPAWSPDAMKSEARFVKYGFASGFHGLPAHGRGDAGTDRTIEMKIPRKLVQGGPLTTSSTIAVGMKVFYDDNGPTVATDEESLAAYGRQRQYHGWGVYKNELGQARINLDPIRGRAGVGEGAWATPEEVWSRPLGANPLPNIVRPFPAHYTEQQPAAAPLRAEGKDFALATRIENEATLALSSKAVLQELVTMLGTLSEDPGRVNEIMRRDPLLAQFEWALHKENGGDPMLFTDKYMDDRRHVALRSGVGIRRRSTDKATKLNVKTGEGYNVGKVNDHDDGGYDTEGEPSDVYRRHEIGFDLAPEATPQQIGAYLGSGLAGTDPWNVGGIEANKTTRAKVEQDIDFSDLAYRLVLQGHRTKFRLEAKKDGRTINIELSCDHTVGRTFDDFQKDPDANVHDVEARYHHIYNLEMELEHLGAATLAQGHGSPSPEAQQPSPSGATEGRVSSANTVVPTEHPPRPDHPGRTYLGKDASSPAFNTPSYQVFAHAKDRVIELARTGHRDLPGLPPPPQGAQLEKAPQKLEALYRAVNPPPSAYQKPQVGAKFHTRTQGYRVVESEHADSLCAALVPHCKLSIEALQAKAPETLAPEARLRELAKLIKRKIVMVSVGGTLTGATYGEGAEARVLHCDGRYHAMVTG